MPRAVNWNCSNLRASSRDHSLGSLPRMSQKRGTMKMNKVNKTMSRLRRVFSAVMGYGRARGWWMVMEGSLWCRAEGLRIDGRIGVHEEDVVITDEQDVIDGVVDEEVDEVEVAGVFAHVDHVGATVVGGEEGMEGLFVGITEQHEAAVRAIGGDVFHETRDGAKVLAVVIIVGFGRIDAGMIVLG